MKKIYTFFVVTLLFIGCSRGQSERIDDCILWKISGNGLEKPSYLLGTYHEVELKFLDSIPQFWEIYNSVECLITEVNFTDKETLERMEESNKEEEEKFFMPGDTTYQMLYSPSDFHVIDSAMKAENMIDYQQFMPEYIAESFFDNVRMKSLKGCMDIELQIKALKDHKEILELDSIEFCQVYENSTVIYDLKKQAKELLKVVTNIDSLTEECKLLELEYRQQKIMSFSVDSIKSRFNRWIVGSEKEMDAGNLFHGKRNELWMEKIPAYISQKSSLIVVGCGHLVNENGLIYALRDMGYTVNPVMSE